MITSLAGEPCRVRTGLAGTVNVAGKRNFRLLDGGDGVVEIDVAKGESVTLYSGASLPDDVIWPVKRMGQFQPWGAVRGSQK